MNGIVAVKNYGFEWYLHYGLTEAQAAEAMVTEQIEKGVTSQAVTRMIGAVERRLPEGLNLKAADLAQENWDTIEDQILDGVSDIFEKRKARYFGDSGSLEKQASESLSSASSPISDLDLVRTLMGLKQEEMIGFDKRTRRQIKVQMARFSYLFHTAQQLEKMPEEASRIPKARPKPYGPGRPTSR